MPVMQEANQIQHLDMRCLCVCYRDVPFMVSVMSQRRSWHHHRLDECGRGGFIWAVQDVMLTFGHSMQMGVSMLVNGFSVMGNLHECSVRVSCCAPLLTCSWTALRWSCGQE